MQNYGAPAGRNTSKAGGIDSKVSVGAGSKGQGVGMQGERAQPAGGSPKGSVPGFSGGIKPGKIG